MTAEEVLEVTASLTGADALALTLDILSGDPAALLSDCLMIMLHSNSEVLPLVTLAGFAPAACPISFF